MTGRVHGVLGLDATGQRGGHDVGRRHQAVNILMVLVEHHTVKTEFVRISQLVDILLV